MWRVLAELSAALHAAIVFILLFGWLWPDLWRVYGALLFGTLVSWVGLRSCVLIDFENYFRLKSHLDQPPQSNFLGYWGERLFGAYIPSNRFMWVSGYIFLLVSLAAWIYRVVPSFI